MEPFEGGLDFMVDNNTFHQIRYAVCIFAWPGATEAKPEYFHLYANNQIEDCRDGIVLEGEGVTVGANYLGNVFRENTINGLTDFGASVTTMTATNSIPWVNMNVFDGNTATNLAQGFMFSTVANSAANVILRNNSFSLGNERMR